MLEALPWLARLNIVAVDLILSGDNAVVIGALQRWSALAAVGAGVRG